MRISPNFRLLLSLILILSPPAVLAQNPADVPAITSPTFGPRSRSGAVSPTIGRAPSAFGARRSYTRCTWILSHHAIGNVPPGATGTFRQDAF